MKFSAVNCRNLDQTGREFMLCIYLKGGHSDRIALLPLQRFCQFSTLVQPFLAFLVCVQPFFNHWPTIYRRRSIIFFQRHAISVITILVR